MLDYEQNLSDDNKLWADHSKLKPYHAEYEMFS